MLEDDQTEFVEMILNKCKSLDATADDGHPSSSLDLVRAIQAVKTGTDINKRSKQLIKDRANDYSNKQALELYITDLLERGKTSKAYVLINNAIKFHYREPMLWQLLGTVYQLKAQEEDDEFLTQKAVVAFQKSGKYASIQINGCRNRGRLARDCLLNSSSYLHVISYVLETEID